MAVKSIFLAAILAACVIEPAAATVDAPVITLTSNADIATRRTALITAIWGTATLPTTQSVVTAGVADPYAPSPVANVARVDQYVANMANGQTNGTTNTGWVWVANSPNNGHVVIVNMGHQGTCDFPSYSSSYNTKPLLTALLAAGYSVYGMNMPGCSAGSGVAQVAVHNGLLSTYNIPGLQSFLEPAVQAMNYWQAHGTFNWFGMVGLSGGGWTTTILSAIDPRVSLSIPVAGSLPGIQQVAGCPTSTDDEQLWVAFFTISGYLDDYLMAASGLAHRQIQILNIGDNGVFGPAQWGVSCSAAYSGKDWYQYLAYYWGNLISGAASASITPYRYTLYEDPAATSHQISTGFAIPIIMNALLPSNTIGGRHR